MYQEFSCDVCGSTLAVDVPYVRQYTGGQYIHICKTCGFIYVKKRRSYGTVANEWSDAMAKKAYRATTPLMKARHTYVAEFLHQKVGLRGKRVCDIGAWNGRFLEILRNEYGAKVFGIEPSKAHCTLMKSHDIPCFRGAVEDYVMHKQQKRWADIVTMLWTLENTPAPKEMLRAAHTILKPRGHVVVATGSRILVPFAKPLSLYLGKNPVDTHPSRFSFNTLTSLLRVCGFEAVHVSPYLNDGFLMCVIGRKAAVPKRPKIVKDDYRKVAAFFKKWHKDSTWYDTRDARFF